MERRTNYGLLVCSNVLVGLGAPTGLVGLAAFFGMPGVHGGLSRLVMVDCWPSLLLVGWEALGLEGMPRFAHAGYTTIAIHAQRGEGR